MRPLHARRRTFAYSLLIALTAAACTDDGMQVTLPQGTEVGVVVNSVDRTLSVFDVDAAAPAATIGLGPDGSPVSIAVRGTLAVVPLGVVPGAAVVDLAQRTLLFTVPLPANSGATGVAFLNDSIAVVGNPGRNSVSLINARRGTAGAELAVGMYPQAAASAHDTVFVLNANLDQTFSPAGPSTVSVITGAPPHVVATIPLTGNNAGAAWAGSDGRLYVLDSGSFGAGDGSLSIIDRHTLAETQRVSGFGEFPGGVAYGDDRRVYSASFSYGLAVWDALTGSFVRSPANAVAAGGVPSSSAVSIDAEGRVYTALPECHGPASVYRLNSALLVDREITTGICPIAIAFTHLP